MFDGKTAELIEQYFDAFSNFYAIISMKRAFRIIKEQNPELDLREDDFIEFVNGIDIDKGFYIIVYDEEMYGDEPCDKTDCMKKFLINEFLYAVDDEAYDEMKHMQDGLIFYVPEKETLLKYSDQFYFEKNDSYFSLKTFLTDELRLTAKQAENVLEEWNGEWTASTYYNEDIDDSIDIMIDLSHGAFEDFKDFKQYKKFAKLYYDMYNNTRMPMYRGHTPKEVNLEACD